MCHRQSIGWLLVFSFGAFAQQTTRVDIRTQSKAVDFSAANVTKPMKTGSVLPATCSTGEMFYKIDAAAGANVFGCTTLNVWTAQGSSAGGAVAASQLVDLLAIRGTPAVLTISPAAPYSVIGCGDLSNRLTNAATATLAPGAGSGTVWIYFDCASARLTVGAGLTDNSKLSCNSHCTVAPGINAFPANAVRLYAWTAGAVADQWDPAGGTDWRRLLATKVTRAGTNTVAIENPDGSTTLAVDTTVVPQWFVGAGVPSQNCSTGRDFYTDTAGQALYFCIATNTWKKASQ